VDPGRNHADGTDPRPGFGEGTASGLSTATYRISGHVDHPCNHPSGTRAPVEQHVQHEEVTVSAYTSTTESLTITEARTRLAEVIDHARAEHEPVYLTRRGRRERRVSTCRRPRSCRSDGTRSRRTSVWQEPPGHARTDGGTSASHVRSGGQVPNPGRDRATGRESSPLPPPLALSVVGASGGYVPVTIACSTRSTRSARVSSSFPSSGLPIGGRCTSADAQNHGATRQPASTTAGSGTTGAPANRATSYVSGFWSGCRTDLRSRPSMNAKSAGLQVNSGRSLATATAAIIAS